MTMSAYGLRGSICILELDPKPSQRYGLTGHSAPFIIVDGGTDIGSNNTNIYQVGSLGLYNRCIRNRFLLDRRAPVPILNILSYMSTKYNLTHAFKLKTLTEPVLSMLV